VASAATGAPILHDALAYVDCELDGAVTAGDHRILLGRVLSAGRLCDDKEPLAFYKGGYR
jgi:3-hydroxy-9,10-secoandrosta-1,3,5(10)-triene-9,17-dione monooxygenase reductase component